MAEEIKDSDKDVVEVTAVESTEKAADTRKKRFHFQETYDVILLRAVNAKGAHTAAWCQKATLFDETRTVFLQAIPSFVFTLMQEPTSKTIVDRFGRLIQQKENVAASGIIEEYGEKQQLLDDIILEMDEHLEYVGTEKEKKTEAEKKLVLAGAQIQNIALNRVLKKKAGEYGKASDSGGSSTPMTLPSEHKKRVHMQDDDNVRELIMEDMKRRRVHEEGQTALARQRLEFDKEHAAINQNRFLQNQEVTERRIRL